MVALLTEVNQLDLALLGNEHVHAFHVTVHHVRLVEVLHCLGRENTGRHFFTKSNKKNI